MSWLVIKSFITCIIFLFSMNVLSNELIYPIEKNKLIGFVDSSGKIVVLPKFDADNIYFRDTGRENLFHVNKNGKRGILNTAGKLIIPTIYDNNLDSFDFNRGNIASYTLNKKCGYISDKNQIISKNIYERCSAFSEQRAAVRLNNKWALIDQKNTLLSDFIYDEINAFSKGLAVVSINGKYGYIDINGKVVIPLIHALALEFSNGLARVGSVYSPYYFIGRDGKKKFDVKFDHVYPFVGNYAVIRKEVGSGELYGLIDEKGDTYIKPKFQEIMIFENNPKFAMIKKIKSGTIKVGVMDIETKKIVVEPVYDYISMHSYDKGNTKMISFKNEEEKYGWMNQKFEIVVPAQFDEILSEFGNDNIALIELGGKRFYINQHGKKIIDFYY